MQTNIWAKGTRRSATQKETETQRLLYASLRQSKANTFDKSNRRARGRSMEVRYYMDGRHRDRWQKHNSYVGRLDLETYSKRWWETKNLVFGTNKHVPISHSVVFEKLKKSLPIPAEPKSLPFTLKWRCFMLTVNLLPNLVDLTYWTNVLYLPKDLRNHFRRRKWQTL